MWVRVYRVDDVAGFEVLRGDEDALANGSTTGTLDVNRLSRHIHLFRRESVPVTYGASHHLTLASELDM